MGSEGFRVTAHGSILGDRWFPPAHLWSEMEDGADGVVCCASHSELVFDPPSQWCGRKCAAVFPIFFPGSSPLLFSAQADSTVVSGFSPLNPRLGF